MLQVSRKVFCAGTKCGKKWYKKRLGFRGKLGYSSTHILIILIGKLLG